MNYEYDGFDTHCVRCNAGIYFDVGFNMNICPSCGGNYEKTDSQLEEENCRREDRLRKQSVPEYWYEDMCNEIENSVSYFEMMFLDVPSGINYPSGVVEKANWVKNKLEEIKRELRQKG